MSATRESSRTPAVAGNLKELPPHAPLTQFYPAPEARRGFVSALFDRTAGGYDRVSALIAFGSDRRYRRQALLQAGLRPGLKLLDVATGTGLVLRAALELGLPARDLVGLDLSRGMLKENKKLHRMALVQGMGERLPFRAGSFDFVAMGYALRHVADLSVFFSEVWRVLAPSGRVLVLEITRPKGWLPTRLLRFYLLKVVPCMAAFLGGRRDAALLMAYYWATIEQCTSPSTILGALSAAGFMNVCQRTRCGILSDYRANKE